MSGVLRYFAYGSNLHPGRLRRRVPSATVVGVATLPGHALAFHKRGDDGSGKCNARPARAQDRVMGVVYRMDAFERALLDRVEGPGYAVAQVELEAGDRVVRAFTYLAWPEACAEELVPFDWYKALVLAGGRHHGLPEAYLRAIDAVTALEDPDRERARRHFTILDEG